MKNTETYWNSLLDKYLNGTISKNEKHALERQALEDPFLMDALEGYQQEGQHAEAVNDLRDLIQKKPDKKRKSPFVLRYAIAAGLALVLAATMVFRVQIDNQDAAADTVVGSSQAPVQEEATDLYADASVVDDAVIGEVTLSEEKTEKKSIAKNNTKKKPKTSTSEKVASTTLPADFVDEEPSEEALDMREQEHNIEINKAAEYAHTSNTSDVSRPDAAASLFKSQPAMEREGVDLAEEDKEDEVVVTATKVGAVPQQNAIEEDVNDLAKAQMEKDIASTLLVDNANMVTGTVVSSRGGPIAFASVYLKGTEVGTTTNIDGQFNLVIEDNHDTLVVSYVGYERAILPIAEMDSDLTIPLSESLLLDEVVIADIATADTYVMSYILARDGETQAYPSKGLEIFKKDIQIAIAKYRTGPANQIGITDVVFTVSPAGYINDIEYKFSSCNECKPIIEKLLQESEPWITIPSNQEVKIEYRFDFL